MRAHLRGRGRLLQRFRPLPLCTSVACFPPQAHVPKHHRNPEFCQESCGVQQQAPEAEHRRVAARVELSEPGQNVPSW